MRRRERERMNERSGMFVMCGSCTRQHPSPFKINGDGWREGKNMDDPTIEGAFLVHNVLVPRIHVPCAMSHGSEVFFFNYSYLSHEYMRFTLKKKKRYMRFNGFKLI